MSIFSFLNNINRICNIQYIGFQAGHGCNFRRPESKFDTKGANPGQIRGVLHLRRLSFTTSNPKLGNNYLNNFQ